MLKLYADDAYFANDSGGGYSDYAFQADCLRQTFRRLLCQLARRGLTGGRLLEVGCGYGYLLAEAKPYFSFRAGTDFSARAVEQARKQCDCVMLGGIEAVEKLPCFNVIIAVGVIEHIYDPPGFLDKLRTRLVPGGWLILATPDMGSYWRHLMGRRWASFKLPEHVTYFDRHSLTHLFERTGFGQVQRLGFPHAFPLGLVMEKLGLSLGNDRLASAGIWIPGTTLALAGRK